MGSAWSWIADGSNSPQNDVALALIRITLVLTVAWLVHAAIRRWNPRFRILLWRTAAMGLIVVFVLSQTPFRLNLPLLPAVEGSAEAMTADHAQADRNPATSADVPVATVAPQASRSPQTAQALPHDPVPPTTDRFFAPDTTSATVVKTQSEEHRTTVDREPRTVSEVNHAIPSIFGWCVAAWAIGVGIISLGWLVGVLRLVVLFRQASTVPMDVQTEARAIAAALNYSGLIDVRHSGEFKSPCNVGAWRPRILIPSRQCEPAERQELRASLAHEIAHCQGHDLRWNHLLTLLQALLWFHPLAWRIRLAHADACDELCDARAAGYLGDHALYGRLLAGLALRLIGRQPAAALSMARRSQVRKRIEMVGRNAASRGPRRWQTVGLVSSVAVVMLLIGFASIGRAEAQPSPRADENEVQKPDAAASTPNPKAPETPAKASDDEVFLPVFVKAAATGKPLAGVQVRVYGRINGKRFNAPLTTNEQGRAELRQPASTDIKYISMTVKKSGYVPVHYTWRSDVKAVQLPERLDLKLANGLHIEGSVEDQSGGPIEKATITLNMPITWPGLANHVFTAAKLTTDGEGHWDWRGAPEDTGSVGIHVEHPDFIHVWERASRGSSNVVVLKRGLEVRGRVVDSEGNPIRGATAQLGLDRFGTREPKAKTDAEGVFVIKKCKAGPSAVTVQAPGYSPDVKRIKINDSTEPVDFQLGPAHVLRGRIVDVDGQPLSGVVVAPDTWRGFRTLENRMNTDDEGRFAWNGAPPDAVEYSIFKQGYMSRRNFVMTVEPDELAVTLYPELQVSGSVTDAKTGEPISEFGVRHGYLFANNDRKHWSRDEAVPYTNGKYHYKFEEPMDGHLLQVVAAGYLPKTSRIFKSDEGSVQFDFQLEPGQGPSGTVVTAEGKPAVGAEVGLATREKRAFLDNGHFDRNQNQAQVVSTDNEGRFRFLPQGQNEFALIVFHDAGYAEVTAEELATNDRIVLKPWGKLKGQVLLADKPDVGREVSYSPKRPDDRFIHNYIWSYGYETRTDEHGRFEFDRVIPGPGNLSRVVITAFLKSWQHSPCWQTPVDVQPHETTEATIGGTGRPVAGRIVLARQPNVEIDWTTNEPATIVRWDSQTGRSRDPYARYAANIEASGSFRIPDVPAGDYKLTVPVNNPPRPNACGAGSEIGKAELVFSVPEMAGLRSDDVLQLGDISAELFDTLDAGEAAPEFVAEGLDGGTLRLSDFRGQLVVLDFWATWCRPCLAEMPTFQKLQEQFGENPRFALLSLSCDNTVEPAKEYVKANSLTWHHAHVAGTQAKVPRDYTVRSLPATFLIAPDGTVLAKDLRGADLVRAVSAALKDDKQATQPNRQGDAATPREDKTVKELLNELDDMNQGPELFEDAWANQLRKIAALGPEAVPQLVEELDRTSDDMMLRCLGFTLRAIDDKRAVPGLIRSIPKTLRPSGSDMGLRIKGTDKPLTQFVQQHDLDRKNRGNEYGFGRPVREVFGALQSLTGQDFGEKELYSIFLNNNDSLRQRHAKAVLFHEVAERWADWWNEHGRELTDDPAYQGVKLASLPERPAEKPIPGDTNLTTANGSSNWILESVRRKTSGRVFYDLDTGRAAPVPKRWRYQVLTDELFNEIQRWAAQEGYDMMGDEIKEANGKTLFVIRPLDLQTWELPATRWKADIGRTTMAALKEEGRVNDRDSLLHVDAEVNEVAPRDTATFFYVTREGTPGILYLGIEVHDDSQRPGIITTGDNELNPVAFRKGRRFALSRLVKAN